MLKGARVLVCGGTGFIGTNLVQRLAREGAKVRATRFERTPRVDVPGVEWVQADLRDLEACRRVVSGMDYVFMCAASTSGAAVMATNPLAHVTPNVVMNAHILEASYGAGVKKFVFISSSAAYPPTGDRPVREEEIFEGDPYEAYYSVGWMKRYAEVLCRVYALKLKRPMSTVVVRPSNVYGPWDKFDFATSHVTAALLRRVVERHNPMEVWGTGEDVRDLIFVDDFIDGLVLAFNKSGEHLEVNLAAGRGCTVRDVLETLLRIEGFHDADVRFDPTKPRTIPVRLVDTGRAQKVLGFQAKVGLEEGLRRTIQWYKAQRSSAPQPTLKPSV